MKTQLFLLLLALSVLSTQAQSLSIKGRVTDASQEAVIAANVSLWTIDSTLVTGVTSDAQGKFALPKIKAGDYRLSISFIGLQSENILLKLNKSLDLGDVQLQEDAVSLGEVTVSASNVLQRVDRQIILPSESQLKRSFGAYDLLNNLGIARLQVDNLSNSMSVSGGGAVQTRINGIKVTDKEIAAVRAKDVLRVEFIEDPGKQYGDDELGAVVNIILRRRETGGVVNFQLSDSPHTLWGENFLSAKFNYKNSEWGIDYFNKNGKYQITCVVCITNIAARICPMLCRIAPQTLTNHKYRFCNNRHSNAMPTRHNKPPLNEYKQLTSVPVNNDPKKIRRTKTASASRTRYFCKTNSVIIFASPSLMPGIGTGTGICASTTKITSAMVVNMASVTRCLTDFCIKLLRF